MALNSRTIAYKDHHAAPFSASSCSAELLRTRCSCLLLLPPHGCLCSALVGAAGRRDFAVGTEHVRAWQLQGEPGIRACMLAETESTAVRIIVCRMLESV